MPEAMRREVEKKKKMQLNAAFNVQIEQEHVFFPWLK